MSIQDKFNRANVIYKITKDIDLGGETLTIPEGCTLDFQGGSFSNGTIEGNNTAIQASLTKIFGLDIELTGTWNVSEAYVEWFGAVDNGEHDDRPSIQRALDSPFNTIVLSGSYMLCSTSENNECLIVPKNKSMVGSSRMPPYVDGQKYTLRVENVTPNSIIKVNDYCNIDCVSIDGNNRTDDNLQQIGISSDRANMVRLRNCTITHTYYGFRLCGFEQILEQCCVGYVTIGINVRGIYNQGALSAENTSTTLSNCYVGNSLKEAYLLEGMTYSTILSCAADHCGIPDSNDASLEDSSTYPVYSMSSCNNISVISCGAEQLAKAYKLDNCTCVAINNCRVEYGDSRKFSSNYNYAKTILDFRYSAGCVIDGLRVDNTPHNGKIMYVEHLYSNIALTIRNSPSIRGIFNQIETAGGSEFSVKRIVDLNNIGLPKFGVTSERPAEAPWGFIYFDHDLNKSVYHTYQDKWVDATGAEV